MKLKQILTITLVTGALLGLTACSGDKQDHDHAGHEHEKEEHAEHDHEGDDHDHDHDGEHHQPQVAGPNGGRVLMSMEPHAEFFVTKDRKVQITFLDEDLGAVAPGSQAVTVIAGDRTNPTTLTFAKEGDVLLSAQALPAGDDFPLVFMLKDEGGSVKPTVEKFTLDLSDCPTCDQLEYACTCEH